MLRPRAPSDGDGPKGAYLGAVRKPQSWLREIVASSGVPTGALGHAHRHGRVALRHILRLC
jgi:hypothetical protein